MNEVSNSPPPAPDGKLSTLLQSHAVQLAEHFDSVQIVVTWREGGRTRFTGASHGNQYACEGSTREWLKVEDERIREAIRHENDEA